MPRRRSAKDRPKPNKNHDAHPSNVLQSNKNHNNQVENLHSKSYTEEDISSVKPISDDDTSKACPSQGGSDNLDRRTAALHDELDSFRQRWKRELGVKKPEDVNRTELKEEADTSSGFESKENKTRDRGSNSRERPEDPKDVYVLAKKLFLMGVDLEQDEMHHESIRYYKQAMRLCPDIEKLIFREQCEASLKSQSDAIRGESKEAGVPSRPDSAKDENELPVLDRIRAAFHEAKSDHQFGYCRPAHKIKSNSSHIARLPRDLILQIFRYVVGKELDLASLESLGLVCRGFHILSHDSSLWRSICYTTWSEDELGNGVDIEKPSNIDWRQTYLTKPRVNCDGVYISRTKYIRQGDVGFQDITYRPFHIVRYYRYLRFFPDNRVLILTTNEEPDKIIPIFRHALRSKQFSSELSVLDGTYEFIGPDELLISAEKDFTLEHSYTQQQTYNQRRQARFHWSRQTPVFQKFTMRFKLKTLENRPFKNNLLKWLEYSILSKTELGHELTEFDMAPDTFPLLAFSRVRKFNLRLSEPLPSH